MSRPSLFWCIGLFCPPQQNPSPGRFLLFTIPATRQHHVAPARCINSTNKLVRIPATWLGPRSVAQGWEGRLSYLQQTNILFDPKVRTELAYLGTMVYLVHSGQDKALLHSSDILFTTNQYRV